MFGYRKRGDYVSIGFIVSRWTGILYALLLSHFVSFIVFAGSSFSTDWIPLQYFALVLFIPVYIVLGFTYTQRLKLNKQTGYVKLEERLGFFSKIKARIYSREDIRFVEIKEKKEIALEDRTNIPYINRYYEANLVFRGGLSYQIIVSECQNTAHHKAKEMADIFETNVEVIEPGLG